MRRYSLILLSLGFTAIFIGYLSVWLIGPGAGLSFLGVEMGEWFKFLGLGARRDLFYLPPVTLGLLLAIWTVTWPQQGGFDWRAWAVRALAVLVSLLAFPAIEDISGPVREQYTTRVILIGMVIVRRPVKRFLASRREMAPSAMAGDSCSCSDWRSTAGLDVLASAALPERDSGRARRCRYWVLA